MSVTVDGDDITVAYGDAFELHILIRESSSFGCYFSFWSYISNEFLVSKSLFGLLGTPNGDVNDDWKDTFGNALALPTGNDAYFQPAYDYCRGN